MKNNDNTNRNKILKIFRKYKQLTQQQVADKANINYRQYQKFESGERDVMNGSFKLVCRLLNALEIDIKRLFDFLINKNLLIYNILNDIVILNITFKYTLMRCFLLKKY